MGKKADACVLFHLTVGNDGQLPIKIYTSYALAFRAESAKYTLPP